MVDASSNWTFLTDMARATPCVCGASKGSAFSAEVVVSAAVLVDFGGDIRASGGFRASRGGGGGRLLFPRGVGIVFVTARSSFVVARSCAALRNRTAQWNDGGR